MWEAAQRQHLRNILGGENVLPEFGTWDAKLHGARFKCRFEEGKTGGNDRIRHLEAESAEFFKCCALLDVEMQGCTDHSKTFHIVGTKRV